MAEFTSWVHGTIVHTEGNSDVLLNRTPRGTSFTFPSSTDVILFHFPIQTTIMNQANTFATLAQVLYRTGGDATITTTEVFDGGNSIMSTTGLHNSNPTGTPVIQQWPIVPKDPIQHGLVLTITVTGSENSWIGWNAAGVTFTQTANQS